MIRLAHREDCCGCCACEAACPHGAIRMEQDRMGFRYPVIDNDLCVDCGICEKVCAFKPYVVGHTPKAEAIRFPEYLDKSQSGGLGYALMLKAIQEGMIVYGAAMDSDFVVRHRRVETQEGLAPLRLSKYVQSDMDGIPSQILEDLKSGRRVLFTGTPCQCAGIGSLCAGFRENILLADIICHGVPAPWVWREYLKMREKEEGAKLTGAVFRAPEMGWHKHKELLVFDSHSKAYDTYTFLFYQHLMLRPSCTVCHFARKERPSDITMADCWFVEKYAPSFHDDNRGCSLLLIHTEAGDAFVSAFNENVWRSEIDPLAYTQPNLEGPSKPDSKARDFEKEFQNRGIESVIKHYGPDSRRVRWAKFIAKVKRHI